MEASETMCIAEAQSDKIMESGPTFNPTLPIYPNTKTQQTPQLTDNSKATLTNLNVSNSNFSTVGFCVVNFTRTM